MLYSFFGSTNWSRDPSTSYSESITLVVLGLAVLSSAYYVGLLYLNNGGWQEIKPLIKKSLILFLYTLVFKSLFVAPISLIANNTTSRKHKIIASLYLLLALITAFLYIAVINKLFTLP